MATNNANWGYLRIQDEMKKVGHAVARTTVARTLKDNGIAPSPDRPTSWSTFLKSHADVIAAADFFTVDMCTKRGLVTHHVLFVIHNATRAVDIAGCTPHPNSAFMAQVARNLTDSIDGFLRDMQFLPRGTPRGLVVDNDVLFTQQFCSILADAGVEVTRTAIQAPNMNVFAKRWVQTVKREHFSKLILLGEEHGGRALSELTAHYHEQRPHQGIDNNRIAPPNYEPPNGNSVVVDERLGGLLRSYRRSA